MKKNHVYTVRYITGYGALNPKTDEDGMIDVIASSKAEAYDKAVFEEIPKKDGVLPYGAWVSSVTYNNGRCHYFSTSCGNAY